MIKFEFEQNVEVRWGRAGEANWFWALARALYGALLVTNRHNLKTVKT